MTYEYNTKLMIEALYENEDPVSVDGAAHMQELVMHIKDLQSRLESLEQEMQEQARIIGMGAERELALVAKVDSLEKDAARWNKVLHHVGADNHLGGAQYVIRGISAPENVMRGAVSQHFEKSIDTAMQANKGDR